MSQQDYEYRGFLAQYWDFLRGDTSNWVDRFYFREVIQQSGQPVLDVGCGTGRLLLDYMSDGIDVDGVDNSPDMLDLCRKKGEKLGLQPNLYLQQMEQLQLPRRYRTIIVPSASFQLIISLQDAAEAMRRFYSHLEPGGTLAMFLMILYTSENDQPVAPEDWYLLKEKENPDDGTVVRRYIRNRYDLENQLEHTEERYDVLRDDKVVHSEYNSRSPATRWYTQSEATEMYKGAGFTNIRVFKANTWETAPDEYSYFSVLGIRP